MRLLYVLLLSLVTIASVSAATVTVNQNQQFQTMIGWEAHPQSGHEDPSFPLFSNELFDLAVDELGITRLRLEVRSGSENSRDYFNEYKSGVIPYAEYRCARYSTINDNADPHSIDWNRFHFTEMDGIVEDVVLPIKQRVEANGEKFYLNLNYVAFLGQITEPGCDPNLQFIHGNDPEEYAEIIEATTLHLQSKYGLVPDTWEIILEPEHNSYFDGTYIGRAIVSTASRLEGHGFTPRFTIPSTTNEGNALTYFNAAVSVPGALPYVQELSYHRYSGYNPAVTQAIGDRAAALGINAAMLEHIGSDYRDLYTDLTNGRNSAWQQFALAGIGTTDKPGTYYRIDTTDPANPQIIMNNRAKYLRQYFKHIRPGAVRIGASSSGSGVEPVAFINPDGRYVVVLRLMAGGDTTSITGLPAGTYGIDRTAGNAQFSTLPDITITAGQTLVTSTNTAGSVAIYQKTGGSTPPPDTIPPVRSNAQPSGTLAAGTTSTTLQVMTNELATCKYSTTAGQSFASMSNTFTTTGSTSHSTTVSGLADGQSYNYYVRCQDSSGNANSNDQTIAFSISSSAPINIPGDVNSDGRVDLQDLLAVLQHVGRTKAYQASVDLNSDGSVNLFDIITVTRDWGKNSTPNNNTLPSGLVVGYSFDDGAATDISGNNLHGTVNGATSVAGRYGGALSFDGQNDFIDAGTSALHSDTPYTVTFWMQPSATGSYVVSKRDVCSGFWRIAFDPGEQIVWFTGASGSNPTTASASGAAGTNVWSHVALTWDGTVNPARVYVNGVEAGYSQSTPGSGTVLSDSTCRLWIGAREGTTAFYTGILDEFRFYNRVLSLTDIQQDMNANISGNYTPPPDTTAPFLSAGAPSGTLAAGTTSTTLQLTTNEPATCKYSTTAGQTYASMPSTFATTGGSSHSASISGLANGQNYNYYVRCQDAAGNANTNDYTVSFSVANPSGGGGSGTLNEPAGMTPLVGTNGTDKYYTSTVGTFAYGSRWTDDAFVQVIADATNPAGSGSAIEKRYFVGDGDGWHGIASINNYNAGPYDEQYFRARVYFSPNWQDHVTGTQKLWYFGGANRGTATDFFVTAHSIGNNNFQVRMVPQVTDASTGQGAMGADGSQGDHKGTATFSKGEWATIEVWMKAQSAPGSTDGEVKIWVNGVLNGHWTGLQWYSANVASTKWDGVQSFNFYGGQGSTKTVNDYIRIGEFYISGRIGSAPSDTTPPVRSGATPSGQLASGTSSTTIGLSTNEPATCKYSTTAGQTYASMLSTFTTTGGSSHSASISGLANGQIYNYYVRCQDAAGNANTNDYTVSFSVANPSGGGGGGSGECQNYQSAHPEWIFCDDFESGDLSAWTSFTPKNQIVTSPVHAGTYTMHIPYDSANSHDVNRFAQMQISSANADHVFVRGYVYFSSRNQEAIQKKLFYIWSSTQSWDVIVNSWKQNGQTGTEPLRLQVQTNCHSFSTMCAPAGVSNALQYDRWYALELEIKANTPSCTAGVNCDAELRVWVDGNLIIERTGQKIRNDATPVGLVRVGAQADDLSKDFDESRYWDNVVISRQPIGTYP